MSLRTGPIGDAQLEDERKLRGECGIEARRRRGRDELVGCVGRQVGQLPVEARNAVGHKDRVGRVRTECDGYVLAGEAELETGGAG